MTAARAVVRRAASSHLLAIFALVVLALALRLWALERVPPGLDPDEAAIGYNAYSLLRTGRDEYGVPYPLVFRSFDDNKRPLYIYAAVPSIALFGPTPFAVRLPAALAGALTIPAMYVLGRLVLRRRPLALAAAALLAVSPWHLQFTRPAREVSVLVLALIILAAALIAAFRSASPAHLRSGPDRPASTARPARAGALLLLAGAAALVALYVYHSGVLFVPLLVVVLTWAYWPRPMSLPRRWTGAAVALVTLGTIPLSLQFAGGEAQVRARQVLLFTQSDLLALAQWRQERDLRDGLPGLVRLLQHPWTLGARQAVDAYLAHFDPTYLFTSGDAEPRHRSAEGGQMYLWDLPLLAAGAWLLFRRRHRPALRAIGGWLLIGPLPGAIAEHAPHAIRSIVMLPALNLMAAAGALPLWRWLRRHGLQWDWLLLLVLSVAFSQYAYHRLYPVEYGRSWSSGEAEAYRQAQAEVDSGRFTRVVIAQQTGLNHVQALYALGYDPASYLQQGGSARSEGATVFFRPFELRPVEWRNEPRDPRVLYVVGGGTTLPPGARVIQSVKGAGGYNAALLLTLV